MMVRKKRAERRQPRRVVESYEHRDKERVNNPPVGLVTPETDRDAGQKRKTYGYDPHLDPQLVWAGKAEHTSFCGHARCQRRQKRRFNERDGAGQSI
ncbi:MAG: hypothetical protein V2G44_08720, partial [bacterium JZ-2024 1]